MSPQKNPGPAGSPRARAAVLALLLAAAAAAAGTGLAAVLRNRVPLNVLWGGTLRLEAALAVALVLALLALGATLRAAAEGRGPAGWWFARAAAYLLLGAAVVQVAWFQPCRTLVVQVLAGAAGGLFGALVLAAGVLQAHVPRRARGALDLVLLNAAVVLLGGELGLRAWNAVSPSPAFAPVNAGAVEMIERWKLKPELAGPGFLVNAEGCHDEEFRPGTPQAPVACTLGDSFSAAIVPHRFHFTTVAERARPGLAIHNVGMSAIGPREYEHLLRNVALPLRPVAVVVDLFVGNDLTAPLDEPAAAGGGALRAWLDRERLYLTRLPRLWSGADPAPRAVAVAAAPSGPLAEPDLLRLYPWLGDPLREVTSMNPAQYQRLEAQRARDTCGAVPPPWPALFATLRRMRAACAERGVAFGVMIIPDEFQVEDRVWRLVQEALPGEQLERDRPQRVLGEFCAQEGIPCLDLLPRFRAVPPLPDGDRHLYHRDDSHWNRRGNEQAGAALAEFLGRLLET